MSKSDCDDDNCKRRVKLAEIIYMSHPSAQSCFTARALFRETSKNIKKKKNCTISFSLFDKCNKAWTPGNYKIFKRAKCFQHSACACLAFLQETAPSKEGTQPNNFCMPIRPSSAICFSGHKLQQYRFSKCKRTIIIIKKKYKMRVKYPHAFANAQLVLRSSTRRVSITGLSLVTSSSPLLDLQ